MDAITKVNEQVRELRSQLEDLQSVTRDHARRAARTAEREVRQHPYRAIGMAAAAGLLLGLLAARR